MDCLLLGSDEIWNMNKPAFQNPLLYGIGINSVRKIGYAVSVGNVTAKKMSSFPELLRGIEALDAVLYRDMHTQETLHALQLHAEAGICDPTIQVDIWKYMKKPEEVLLPEYDYIAVYSYYIDDTRKSQIQRFAKEHELKIVAVSLPLDWCDFYLNCSPLEFGAVLSKAKYVFTSTFHGTIFASLYHMRFVSLPALPKVADVLFLLGLEDHILPENADYYTLNEMLEHDYCFEEMEKRLEQLRAESYDCYEKFVKGW